MPYFHSPLLPSQKDCCKRSLKEASKSGCHSRNQYYPAVVREVESAGKRMGKCSTDLHGNALAPRTSAKQMCDPCTGHDKWNECGGIDSRFPCPASMTSVIPFDAVSLKCRYNQTIPSPASGRNGSNTTTCAERKSVIKSKTRPNTASMAPIAMPRSSADNTYKNVSFAFSLIPVNHVTDSWFSSSFIIPFSSPTCDI